MEIYDLLPHPPTGLTRWFQSVDARELPDVHVSNPTGSTNIFYDIYAGGRCASRDHLLVDAVLPCVDRFEELLQWWEGRVAANGVALPYLQPGFEPESVMPPLRASASQAAPSSEPPDLPPLMADGAGMAELQLDEADGQDAAGRSDDVMFDPFPYDDFSDGGGSGGE